MSMTHLCEDCLQLWDEVKRLQKPKGEFLWPCEEDSVEQAGYEFCNGLTEEYRQQWWEILCKKLKAAQAE